MPKTKSIQLIWGLSFVGFSISLSLYGVTLAQTMFYTRFFPDDPMPFKLLVLSVFILDTLHVCCIGKFFWNMLIAGHANVSLASTFPWELTTSIFLTCLIGFIVQIFYCDRIWTFSNKNKIVTFAAITFAIIQMSTGIVFTVRELKTEFPGRVSAIIGSVQYLSSIICDIIITASMVYYLRSNRSGEKSTEAILQKFLRLTVNTGLLVCLINLTAYILLYTRTGPFTFSALQYLISKCYVNSFLAMLSARKELRSMFYGESSLSSIDETQYTSNTFGELHQAS